jgi:plasmid stability protein
MTVNLSIKNVPDRLAERLRRRAARHHRSLQGELMAILEESLNADGSLDAEEVLARVRALRLETPDEATRFVRDDRDARSRR